MFLTRAYLGAETSQKTKMLQFCLPYLFEMIQRRHNSERERQLALKCLIQLIRTDTEALRRYATAV